MNVMVLAPHPDDETIGCGGTIRLHVDRGDRVVTAFLTSGELGLKDLAEGEAQRVREAEATAAAGVLGVAASNFLRLPDWGCGDGIDRAVRLLAPVVKSERPQLIYLPHPRDDHPDHRACITIGIAVFQEIRESEPELRGYEVWTPLAEFDVVEDVSRTMERKLAALAQYHSQLRQYRYDRAVTGLNQYRGALAGRCDFAEVFVRLHGATDR